MTKNKIAIITTRQNFKWISMQEVLPALESCWAMTTAESKLINIDQDPLRSFMSYLLQCDAIVIIAFNETIARFMKIIRENLKLSIPFIFHLHGLATLALWPLDHFKVLPVLNNGDLFIGTCPGDKHCLDLIFEKTKHVTIPYPFIPLEKSSMIQINKETVFAYIGRISDQKNIDVLIRAYHLLSLEINSLPLLLIYGQEDHLGSPNMSIKSAPCLKQLLDLVKNLRLEEKIIFKGFVAREDLYSELGAHHISLSASTHSDENFGMAIMRSLSLGAIAVTTRWGGHIVFDENFRNRVFTVTVDFGNDRPRPSIDNFKEAMKKALDAAKKLQPQGEMLSNYFLPKEIAKQLDQILQDITFSQIPLTIKPEIQILFSEKKRFAKAGDIQKIFGSYQDPMAIKFLKAYTHN